MKLEYFSVETDQQKDCSVYLFSTKNDIKYDAIRKGVQSLIYNCDELHKIELWLSKTDDLMHGKNITKELATMGYQCALCPSLLKEDKYNVIGVKGFFNGEEKEITFIANTDLILVVDFTKVSIIKNNTEIVKGIETLVDKE